MIAIAPNDPEAYYTVGFVDWVSRSRMRQRFLPPMTYRCRRRQSEEEQGRVREAEGGEYGPGQ